MNPERLAFIRAVELTRDQSGVQCGRGHPFPLSMQLGEVGMGGIESATGVNRSIEIVTRVMSYGLARDVGHVVWLSKMNEPICLNQTTHVFGQERLNQEHATKARGSWGCVPRRRWASCQETTVAKLPVDQRPGEPPSPPEHP